MRVLDWQWKFITQFEKNNNSIFSFDLWQHGKSLKNFNTLVSKIKRYIEYSSFDKGGRRARIVHGWGTIACFNRIAFERIEIWKLTYHSWKSRGGGRCWSARQGRQPWSCFGRWGRRKIIAVGGGYQTGQVLLYKVPLNDLCCSYSVLPPTFLLSFLY